MIESISKPINVILVDNFNRNSADIEIINNHDTAIEYLNTRKDELKIETFSIPDLQNLDRKVFEEYSSMVVWLDNRNPSHWSYLAYQLDVLAADIRKIFIFDQEDFSSEVLVFGAESFACPFNEKVLFNYILAGAVDTMRERFLNNYRIELNALYRDVEDDKISPENPYSDIAEKLKQTIFSKAGIGQHIKWTKATLQLCIESNYQNTQDKLTTRSILIHDDEQEHDQNLTVEFLKPVEHDAFISIVLAEEVPNAISDIMNKDDQNILLRHWTYRSEIDDIRSWLGIPLIRGKEQVGIIIFSHTEPQAYEKFNNSFLRRYAHITLDAIDDIFRRRNSYFERRLALRLNESSDLPELASAMLKTVNEALGSEVSTYFQINDLLETRTFIKVAQEPLDNKSRSKPDMNKYVNISGIAGTVLSLPQERRIVMNAIKEPDFIPSESVKGENTSLLVIPLKVGDRVIGVINTHKHELDAFHRYDVILLETFSRQASVVIERTYALDVTLNNAREINQLFIAPLGNVSKFL